MPLIVHKIIYLKEFDIDRDRSQYFTKKYTDLIKFSTLWRAFRFQNSSNIDQEVSCLSYMSINCHGWSQLSELSSKLYTEISSTVTNYHIAN